jgi:UDP-glucose 4-epimerase|tara:strand:+ start:2092 stop:3126 length:1035 start_codon:yes stop_codon:yes gene_type:complete
MINQSSKIIVTGGLGYIGSHTVVELQSKGYEVVIVDNLSNSSIEVLNGLKNITGKNIVFENVDLKKSDLVTDLFERHSDLSGVIHFAASKAVGESVEKPLDYYENNIYSLVNVLKALQKLNKSINFIFSSSCTVYGQAETLPISEEESIKKAESPYGNTKQICEEIITDTVSSSKNLKAISLRYFNPIGAHESSEIGELPLGIPQNLVPFITQTGAGIRSELIVFGDDYPTIDGTCVRDYIHVVDLAKAHIAALTSLINNTDSKNYEYYNIGTGRGTSILQAITSFEKVSKIKLKYKIGSRRIGDITSAYADTSKANKKLNWTTKLTLDQAMESAWKWQKKISK